MCRRAGERTEGGGDKRWSGSESRSANLRRQRPLSRLDQAVDVLLHRGGMHEVNYVRLGLSRNIQSESGRLRQDE